MIESMNSNEQVEASVHVAYNYGINKFKEVNTVKDISIVVFPTFEEVDGVYSWVYDESEDGTFYCLKGENYNYSIARYENNKCGKYERIKMDKEWCDSYTGSTLVYEDGINGFCEE